MHDISKFYPDEWFPYVEFFYGNGENKDEFEKALAQHYKRNPHHWNYWVSSSTENGGIKLPMDEEFLYEMIADWIAMGRSKGFVSCGEWYKTNRDNIRLHPFTRKQLEKLLRALGQLEHVDFEEILED
jgi:hypothetical protein